MQKEHTQKEKPLAPIRVGIVDDYDVVRAGLERLFARYGDLCIVGSATNGLEALELVSHNELDVLVLDIAMPGHGAVDVLEGLLASQPDIKVLIFTGYPEQRYALPMIRLGARGYVDKASPLLDIVEAVRVVASGRSYFSSQVRELMAEAVRPGVIPGEGVDLTAREFQIFLRLAAGETVTEIARALSLSDVTISSHRSRLLSKLKLSSNSHLTRFALENHFLT